MHKHRVKAFLFALLLASPAAAQRVPQYTLQQEMRIDGHEADLVPIGWLGVARNGTIALTQGQDHAIKFFNASGQPTGSFGREGSGPGEFKAFARRAGWIGDTIWVFDGQLNRLTFVSPERKLARTLFPFAAARPKPADSTRLPAFPFIFPWAVYPDGTILVDAQPGAKMPAGYDGWLHVLVRVSSNGVIERLIARLPISNTYTFDYAGEKGPVRTSIPIPFDPAPFYEIAPDGSRIATLTTALTGPEANTFRLTMLTPTGSTVFSRQYPFKGVPLPRNAVDSVINARLARAQATEVKRALEGEVRKRAPSFYPPVSGLFVGSDGRTWIGLRETPEGRPWLVVDGKGEPVANVLAPREVTLRVANATHVWALQRDEFDVQSVIRYRIAPR
jgi:hypothetical protein